MDACPLKAPNRSPLIRRAFGAFCTTIDVDRDRFVPVASGAFVNGRANDDASERQSSNHVLLITRT
jgi:hypothetical protein